MKKFILVILSVLIAAATLFTACAKPTTDSDVSTGSSADVESSVQSAISSEDGGVSADDPLSASVDENSVESQISSEDSTDSSVDSSDETSEDGSEDTSDVVAAVTPSKPDDTSAESKSEASEAPVINTPVESTTDPITSKAPTEDNTSEEHVHSYSARWVYATCTTDGYQEHTCSCGDSYKTDITSAYGHYLYKKSSVAATLEAEGTELWECARCHNYSETKTTPKLVLYTISDEEIELICTYFIELLNEERAKLGAPALSTAPIAHEMAMVRAEQLTTLFSHKMPDGRDSRFIYKDYQYNPEYRGIGADGKSNCLPFSSSEDIAAIHTNALIVPEGYERSAETKQTMAYNTAYSMIMNFSRSAGHWADLMNPEYTGVGVGYAYVNTPDGYSEYLCVMTMDKTYG